MTTTTTNTNNSTITASLLTPENEAEYQSFHQSHSKAHYGQSLATKQLIEKHFKFKPIYIIAREKNTNNEDPNNNPITGILPLFECNSLIEGKRLASIPFLPLGGPLTTNKESETALLNKAKELTNSSNANFCELRIQGDLNSNEAKESWTKQTPITNFFLDLKETKEQTIASLHKSIRYDIRKAKKQNLKVSINNSKTQLDDFYQIYLHTRKKRGVPSWPKGFFQDALESHESIIAVTYLNENKIQTPIAAAFCFIEKSHSTLEYGFAGTNYKYNKYCPYYILLENIIKYCHKNNLKTLEFGGSTKEMNQGKLWSFKKRWANRTEPIPYYFYAEDKNNIPTLKSNFKLYTIYGKIWSHIPKPIIKLISPPILRQFH